MQAGPPSVQRVHGPSAGPAGSVLRDPRIGQQLRFRPPKARASGGERPRGAGPPPLSYPWSTPPMPMGPRLVRAAVPTRFVQTASGLLVPDQIPNPHLGIETNMYKTISKIS